MKRIGTAFLSLFLVLALAACSAPSPQESPQQTSALSEVMTPPGQESGQIYLYGEYHGVDRILEKELELWSEYYHNYGMRHLFVESPYYTAEYLNLWMQAEDDTILNQIYTDWEGTAAHNPDILAFYQTLKQDCPETVFHGTDVGHQYDTTGERYLAYLREQGMENSEQYRLAQEAVEQGKRYYGKGIQHDDVYRENTMAENFIRAHEQLDQKENIMGIYGAAHTGLDDMDYTGQVSCMATQLKEFFGDAIHSEDISWMAKDIEPERIDTITVNGTDYQASYFGTQDLTGFKDYSYREFWRLEDAYSDFQEAPLSGDVLPYDNYPMLIEEGQVFVIDHTKTDGSVQRMYFRSDGTTWNGLPTTVEFLPEEAD